MMSPPKAWRGGRSTVLSQERTLRPFLQSTRKGQHPLPMPASIADPASSLPWRSWYSLQRWRVRAKHQLRIEPLCALCLARNCITPATIADHDPPHKGDWNKFRLGPLQSLCRDCHKGKWATDARGYSSDIGVRRRDPRQSRLPQGKGGATCDPQRRGAPRVPAEILARPQSH